MTLPTLLWDRIVAVSGVTNKCLDLAEGFSGVFCPREPWILDCSVNPSTSAILLLELMSFEERAVLED